MYSYDERMKAVQLYIQYDLSLADTVRALGYPDKSQLKAWYKEFIKQGDLHQQFLKPMNYSEVDRQAAVDYFLQHGRSITRTIRKLGYPSRPTLRSWIKELAPQLVEHTVTRQAVVKFSSEQKQEAVIELCARETAAAVVARRIGTTRSNLYVWKNAVLGKEYRIKMKRDLREKLSDDTKTLQDQVRALQKQIDRQHIELDILTKAAELLKKDQGIDLNNLNNGEKVMVVDALKVKYPLKDLLYFLKLSKSSYYYQKAAQCRPEKYQAIRADMKLIFQENYSCYGYRRIHAEVRKTSLIISEKVIRRLMHEEQLIVNEKRIKKYSSYQGEISPEVENVVARDFHADTPNTLWLTDLTEFHIPAGKVYLSPMVDCFDGIVVTWSIGTSPNAELVNTMLDSAINVLDGERPIIHNDRGCHYRWPGWITRMEDAQLTRSMSKKGCSPDNAACEGFFGRMKNECFYNRCFKDFSIDQFIDYIDRYIHWYNTKRIKKSLGYLSPAVYRQQLGLAS